MKTSQLLAAGALLAGYVQACTRVRVDQSRDQSDSSMKYTTITAYDDDRAPIRVTDHRSKIDQSQNKEVWFFRQSTGQLDVSLDYYQGTFAKNIGGKVAFPWVKDYISGGNTLDLKQKAEYTYTNESGIEHLQ
ncbi:hypothetical protein Slin15195_G076760 [Septoria linicola]|uniref:Uncharacterized protein n=1 Tax=Septoria linicola TaxID=215465 RepID=A0A9Q9AYT1_9PEZI|nr:hypothetical protein Slin15195_G076760 [Septoria linicola]